MGIQYNLLVDNEDFFSFKHKDRSSFSSLKLDPNRALIKRKFGDIFWNSTALNSCLYQEDQQNLPMSINLPFARDPDPSCKCSARCLPG